jgi:hypothetical protein
MPARKWASMKSRHRGGEYNARRAAGAGVAPVDGPVFLSSLAYSFAAQGGRLVVLRYAHEQGLKFSEAAL